MVQIWKDIRLFIRFIHNGETQNKHITIGNWLNMILYPDATKRDNDPTRWPENENIFRTYKRLREFTSFPLFLRKSFELMLQHNEWVNQERQIQDPGNSGPTPGKSWQEAQDTGQQTERGICSDCSGEWGLKGLGKDDHRDAVPSSRIRNNSNVKC